MKEADFNKLIKFTPNLTVVNPSAALKKLADKKGVPVKRTR